MSCHCRQQHQRNERERKSSGDNLVSTSQHGVPPMELIPLFLIGAACIGSGALMNVLLNRLIDAWRGDPR